ncbi:uncharacterized protein LOC125073949 isoform X1 [Vanessa atalanta]|uniref:uncharacterized protein LOC125073949 isoform X1 n=1 Tax=Vanessa atalanta TaxID=42275 RepID=UPI001FCDBFB9|nr:uncharacterized protein LOC125073949 isoform X1 [Vanessa atalanta]
MILTTTKLKIMRGVLTKAMMLIFLLYSSLLCDTEALPQNKSFHHIRRPNIEDSSFNNQKVATYRSFQPIAIKYHKVYPRVEDRTDYDINAYDSEYGGVVVSNFTSSIYEDNPPLYPNPEVLARSNPVIKYIKDSAMFFILAQLSKFIENKISEPDVELPEDSLGDGDLREHNIIDSVTYLYGFNSCHGGRDEWIVLIFITSGLAIIIPVAATMWLMWSQYTSEFRRNSKIYPIVINLCCCLVACTLIYIQAVVGASSPTQCEKIALVLHYTHISCAMWIVALAAAVAEYCVCDTLLPLKYNYLLAYGVPAIVVTFNYALSMEHYEIKHYCWMSIEKGMVMGFMIPAMILILINTAIVIVGLQSVNKKQTEMLTAKIHELVEHHMTNWPKTMRVEENTNGSVETLDNLYTPDSSRKNTDTSDTLEKEFTFNEEECNYVIIEGSNNDVNGECGKEVNEHFKQMSDRGLLNIIYMDNLSWKWTWNTEGNELKTYLNLCLVLEPFFAINWVMGVVAIENAAHWSTPTIYLILVVSMHIYFAATICTTIPIVPNKATVCCDDVVAENPTLPRIRTTDSIPLLDPVIQQPNVTVAPADTISTISI